MRSHSLARRLIATVLIIQLAASLCVVCAAFFYERHVHFRTFGIMLHGRADSLLGAVQDADDPGDNIMLDGTQNKLPWDDIYEVKEPNGRVLGRSSNWTGLPEGTRLDHGMFFDITLGGRDYRGIRVTGTRIVDPGENGGIRRPVVIYYGSPVERPWMAIRSAVSFYALSSLAVLIVTGLLMGWLLHRGLEPLQQLAARASQVSVTSWAFNPPERARKTRELVPLVDALESLLRGLELSFAQQQRFVGDAAHELKTAVTVVKSSLQLLAMRRRTAGEYQAGVGRALEDCARMEEIVAKMLTLARVEETRAPADFEPANAEGCLTEVFLQLATAAEDRQVRLTLRGPQIPPIRIPSEDFKLLSANILLNAIQHSPADSEVAVEIVPQNQPPPSSFAQSQFVQIRFIDSGDGIHPEDLPRIFERFSRIDPSRSRKTGGTGLGLAICKAIAERYGGSISIASHPQSGTTVTVSLPLAAGSMLATKR
jgi:signal transduction histidine kinase